MHDFNIALTRTFSTTQKSQKIDTQKSSTISSSLLFNALKSVCKAKKKSTVISIEDVSEITSKKKIESRFRTAYLSTKLKASRLSFSLNTFVTISETMKNASIQKVACIRATCKQCEQNFDFNKKLFEHINEHKALKSVKNSSLTSSTLKSLCEIEKKSVDICSSFSHESLTLATSKNLMSKTETSLRSNSSKCSSFQLSALESASKSMKKFSIKQIVCARICKRCKQSFNFNNKLHEHIRQHHVRKSIKNSDFRVSTSESTCNIKKKSTFICSFVSLVSSILFATSRSQIFSTKMISRFVSSNDSNLSIATHKISLKFVKKSISFVSSVSSIFFATSTSIFESISSRCSNFSIATLNSTSKSMKKLLVNSFTSSTSFSRTSVSKHQKFYFIIDDLIRMFHEKSKSFDLRQHQKDSTFSQHFDIRSSRQSRFFYQSRIIVYFLSAVNQKTLISQNLKNSNSKNFQQFTFAKSIRTVFSKNLFEKSIKLSYKKFDVFCINLKSFVETFFFIFIFFRLFSIFLLVFAFVSIIFVAKMNCISVYQQIISIIDHVSIEFVVSKRN